MNVRGTIRSSDNKQAERTCGTLTCRYRQLVAYNQRGHIAMRECRKAREGTSHILQGDAAEHIDREGDVDGREQQCDCSRPSNHARPDDGISIRGTCKGVR